MIMLERAAPLGTVAAMLFLVAARIAEPATDAVWAGSTRAVPLMDTSAAAPFWSTAFTAAKACVQEGLEIAPAASLAALAPEQTADDPDGDDLVWTGERRDGQPYSAWQSVPPLSAPVGTTA